MKYPIGIQNFESLRKDGYTYVDKTAMIHQLVVQGRYYFLSRPRRFGKSLLISTLEAYFSGRRELFSGLAMEKLETAWTACPVLHLDLNTAGYEREDVLAELLNVALSPWEKGYGSEAAEVTLSLRFEGVVRRAAEATGQRVVILVDEYDKPLLQSLGNEALQSAYRALLKSFYWVLKSQDQYIRFALLTGVTKFGKVSVFSDLNNLFDLSMDERYQALCGITEEEIHTYFEASVRQLADRQGLTEEETLARLRDQYDGYHFVENGVGVYNPFSLLNTFRRLGFGSYWFETGTPTYLVRLLQRDDYVLPNLTEEVATADVLNSIDSFSSNPIPVIYQSGYLTIKGYDPEFGEYRLGFPNKEVEEGFTRFLLPFYTGAERSTPFSVASFVRSLRAGRPGDFMRLMSAMFADTDYKIVGDSELYFQNAFYLVAKMLGFYTQVERTTSDGRMDMVVGTHDYLYIIEFKLDGSAEAALRQIDEKGYTRPFAADSRRLYRIGVSFSLERRCIEEWKIE
ncbi:ATP-binding protein [Prevotella denticola]|uniref:ATP-binding protein n=1 Tax=Prevotella denticola TaxID=28129 RepID=UPI00040C34EF|nr:ATP-binding protein [Prevotella denticola]